MADYRVQAYGIAAAAFALDRLTKWIIETRMSVLDTIHVIPGFFDIVHSRNKGMAFSLLNDYNSPLRPVILVGFSAVALLVVAYILWRTRNMDRITSIGLSLVLGGAMGNVFDRIAFGAVTDFLDFYVGDLHWPAFNVADSCIVIGSLLLFYEVLRPRRAAART